ncbi:MAG: hypothetical protein BWX88_03393 [Planctomycetes bacterium ADurb.Bin126]|nr:MAG: hypothetical protein BWX88_03393 [Planctomycetes bacterium ADurb.Bin126]HOD79998.1 hypothetical protein [Phycisphaerae bacterium]HQL73087.1 hypothetical protein [Phycisphaerae bacterium]
MACVNRNSSVSRFLVWPFAVAAAFLAYWCSRGSDGRLVGSIVGFGLLGLAYWAVLWFSGRSTVLTALLHLAVMETAVVIALAVNPQLEEMGGILNYLIPAFIAVIVGVGWLAALSRSARGHPKENE